jgi:hypothetical protein
MGLLATAASNSVVKDPFAVFGSQPAGRAAKTPDLL